MLLFETKDGLPSLNFNGFRIAYIETDDDFILMTKEATSHGIYVGRCKIENVTNKRTKKAWYVIKEAQDIFDKHKYMGSDYALHIVSLLIRMYFYNTSRIYDDNISTGSQYNIAKEAWLKIKEVL
jgi:hypothetical protein